MRERVMATAKELREQANLLSVDAQAALDKVQQLRAEARKAENAERLAARAAEQDAHFERMFTEIGQPLAGLNAEQHAAVYEAAWEQGHSSGYEEVESHYGDYAELARKILDAR